MLQSNSLQRALHHALCVGAAASAALPITVSAGDDQEQITEVVVTGSRIRQPNLTSISPVVAVSNEDIKLQGVTRMEDLVNNLPQVAGDFGGNLSNGATGAATVDLRGLDAQRTMVLVNGRRLMPGDPSQNGNGTPDLNQIPGALVERIEVLTGGASAVYGADAVAGVVNFIMMDDFEGIRVDAQYGFNQHRNDSSIRSLVADSSFDVPDSNVMDGYSKEFTFILGMNSEGGRGNVTLYGGYRQLQALLQSERDYSSCSLASGDEFACIGSSTTSPARFQAIDNDPNSETFGNEVGPGYTLGAGNTLIPYVGAQHAFNFAPFNHYQRPDERYTAGLFAHYDVSDKVEVYSEFMFMNDETVAQVAPSGLFRGDGPANGAYIVNCDNPFLSAAQVAAFCTSQGLGATSDALISIGKRNVEGSGRQDHFQHTSYRAVLGLRGDLNDTWSYDVYGVYGTTEYEEVFLNDVSNRRVTNALVAVTDPTTGTPVCRINVDANTLNDDPDCVPYNIFSLNGVTPGALNYIQAPGFRTGSTNEQILSASVTGDLGKYGIKLPSADTGLAVAFGTEYRREESAARNDVAFSSGDLIGQGGAQLDTFGSFDVKELFMEGRLPLAQDKPFADVVSVEVGYRYSEYNLGFDTNTYKFGADWAPVEAIRLRAAYQRAVRSPNIIELFRPQVVQLDGNSDPCAVDEPGVDTPSRSLEECARTGVTPAQYGFISADPASQYNGLTGGEPNLDPETSDTYTFGIVFTPDFAPGLSVSLDYFDIKVEDIIDDYGADLILRNCLDTGAQQWCSLVHRAPGSGSLWLGDEGYVINLNVNSGSLSTTGVDLEANYRVNLGGAGSLAFQFLGTYVDELSKQPLTGGPEYDCVGFYGTVCETPTMEWRHKFRTTWATPLGLDVSLTWRFLDSVDLDTTSTNPQLTGETFATDLKLDSMNYFDLVAAYNWEADPANVTLRVGVNNVTDKDPPLVGDASCPSVFCSGNTFPQVYDVVGRAVFINVTADF